MINTSKEVLRNKYKQLRKNFMENIDNTKLKTVYEKIGDNIFTLIKQNFIKDSRLSKIYN